MKKRLGMMGLMLCVSLHAQTYDTNNVVVQTFAGSGFSGWVDGEGTQTMFQSPGEIVADTSGNLFVKDDNRIRKITPDGTVTMFAGQGAFLPPGYRTNVYFSFLTSIAVDKNNVVWASGGGGSTSLYRIGTDGNTTVISFPGVACGGLGVDSKNNVYIADFARNQIFRYNTNATVELFAGSGNEGAVDGNGVFTSFDSPTRLAVDAADNIYVWDQGNHLIRKINQNRDVTTIAGQVYPTHMDGFGTNAAFWPVQALCVDPSGNLIIAGGKCVRKLTPSTNALTIAGSFTQTGYTNGAGNIARFKSVSGVYALAGVIYVSDSSDYRIRQITFNPSEQPVTGGNLELDTFPGLRITGTVGRAYRVESSTDTSNWSTETTLLLTSSPYLWIDQNSLGQKKFYRAFMLP